MKIKVKRKGTNGKEGHREMTNSAYFVSWMESRLSYTDKYIYGMEGSFASRRGLVGGGAKRG